MLIPKFDLCKSEWLELVFDDRNKQYGAYELRQHNGRTMVRAMLITFVSVLSIALIAGVLIKPAVTKTNEVFKSTAVHLSNYIKPPIVVPPKPLQHTNSIHTSLPAVTPQAITKFVPLVVTEKPVTAEPPKISTLTGNIGSINAKGPATGPVVDQLKAGSGDGAPDGTGIVSDFKSLEVMPVPYGGASAWSKFLSKNLRYPDMAIDQHVQGKVWVSFIIEADGTLSHFKVEKGVGYGLDEEALRVLKLAPAWKPGQQNGHPVRVQYTIPINFQLSDEQ